LASFLLLRIAVVPVPLGLAHFTALEVPPVELARLAGEAGFATIGLRLFPAFPGAVFYELPDGSAAHRAMRAAMSATGVTLHDIETITIDSEFSIAGIEPVLAAGAALGARRLTVSGDDADFARLCGNFAALCDLSAPYGLSVDIENMAWRRIRTFADALELVDAADRKNAGVLVDALHFFRNGSRPAELRAAPAGRVVSVQLCDAGPVAPTTHEAIVAEARGGRLPPGEGALPLCDLVAGLPEGCVLSAEVPMGDAVPAAERVRSVFAATLKLLNPNGAYR
jgi:sugar phosphate isomerase/epimerase